MSNDFAVGTGPSLPVPRFVDVRVSLHLIGRTSSPLQQTMGVRMV